MSQHFSGATSGWCPHGATTSQNAMTEQGLESDQDSKRDPSGAGRSRDGCIIIKFRVPCRSVSCPEWRLLRCCQMKECFDKRQLPWVAPKDFLTGSTFAIEHAHQTPARQAAVLSRIR